MTEQQIIELYPAICEWLGGKNYKSELGLIWWKLPQAKRDLNINEIDFLNNFDQLQWIEDKLRELGCDISYCYYSAEKIHSYVISDKHDEFYEKESKESKSLALLQAVNELIKKEK